jgi:ABC-type dipeptide/oligopeptide/nickel transport system permease component
MAKELAKRAGLYVVSICASAIVAWLIARRLSTGEYSLGDAIHGLLHEQLQFTESQPVSLLAFAAGAAGRSFALVGGALFLAALFAWPLASLPRRPLIVLAAILMGLATMFLGFYLAFYLGYRWGVTPYFGYCNFFTPGRGCSGPVDWAGHLTLAWIALGAWPLGIYARAIRGARRRALRNSGTVDQRRDVLAPLVLMLSRDFGAFLGWSVLVDSFFGVGGLARLVLLDFAFRAPNVLFAGLVAATVLTFAVKLPLDALWLWLRAPRAHALS